MCNTSSPSNKVMSNCTMSSSNSSTCPLPTISRGMVPTSLGGIGYLICNGSSSSSSSLPIFCFHGSPRSSDEFLEILPLLAASSGGRMVVALDIPGYGVSENPPQSCSINDIADAFLQVINELTNALTVNQFVVLGHLMGNFVAISLASRYPDRVAACLLANIYYFPQKEQARIRNASNNNDTEKCTSNSESDEEKKEDSHQPLLKRRKSMEQQKQQTPPIIIDSFELQDDGSHLTDLYNKRKDWLDPELNLRVIQSEITYLVNRRARYAKGIALENVSEFDYETAASQVPEDTPCLAIGGQACTEYLDSIGYEGTRRFQSGCELLGSTNHCEVVTLKGPTSTINMMNQDPRGIVDLCLTFLEKKQL